MLFVTIASDAESQALADLTRQLAAARHGVPLDHTATTHTLAELGERRGHRSRLALYSSERKPARSLGRDLHKQPGISVQNRILLPVYAGLLAASAE